MRFLGTLAVLVCAAGVCAQTPEDAEVARARLELERVKGLVGMGALPTAQIGKAEEALAETQDRVLLRANLTQQDLTEEKADELVAAANRQFERRKKAFDEAERLVKTGMAPGVYLGDVLKELEFARRQCELMETRARLARELSQMAEA